MKNNVKAGHKNKQSYANTRTTGKEQYYTNPQVVDICMEEVKKHIDLSGKTILEPCGGTGEFIEGFIRAGIPTNAIISCDIEPKHWLVEKANYLEKDMSAYKNLVAITNPPFGRMSSLAKKFFKHATSHCEYICYLIPKSWRKWSTMNSLDENYHLVTDIEMPKNCFYLPNQQETKKGVLNTIFQIWQRKATPRVKIEIPDNGLVTKVIPVQKKVKVYQNLKEQLFRKNEKTGEFVAVEMENLRNLTLQSRPSHVTGVNFEMIVFGHSCGKTKRLDPKEKYDAKTTTMYFNIQREDVKSALQSINFSHHFNNVSYVQALSLQEINYELNKHFGLKNFTF